MIASSPFTVTYNGCVGTTLPAGDGSYSCQVQVNFTPTATGFATGTLTVYDTAVNARMLSIAGTGIAPTGAVSLENSSLTFGPQATGTTSSYQVVTVVNTGNSPVTIDRDTFTGDFNATYYDGCVGQVLVGGNTCQIYLEFTPIETRATESGSLTIATSACN